MAEQSETQYLRDQLRTLWRRKVILALAAAAGLLAALAFDSTRTPAYQASAKVFLGPRVVDRGNLPQTLQELTFSKEFIASYAEMLRSRPYAERVVASLGLRTTGTALKERITTRVIPDTRIIELTVSDTDPTRAAAIGNQLASQLVQDLQPTGDTPAGALQATVFESALRPSAPFSPNPKRDAALGGILVLTLAILTVLIWDHFDTRLRSREDVDECLPRLPVLADIPRTSRAKELLLAVDATSHASESFRILRTNVRFLGIDGPLRTLMVTSPESADGKTLVATNLAASLAAAGHKTVLVDADLRRPDSHDLVGLAQAPGLSEVLVERLPLSQAIRQTQLPSLAMLPAGRVPPNPAELLGSERMVRLIEALRRSFEMIVMDTTPVEPVADATVLGPWVDGAILVVRLGKTSAPAAERTRQALERMRVRTLGVVINEDTARERQGYEYSSYYRSEGDAASFAPPVRLAPSKNLAPENLDKDRT